MNKAITDGIVFDPLPFAAGLALWSSGDGTLRLPSYAISGSGFLSRQIRFFRGVLKFSKQIR
ncbi:MAG: hypothetical protein ACJAZ1_001220 [Yoonia sp.]|jgi:hypothetical protein